ncbi:MAG: LysM peptidoglycan-binding domain-containing protein [Candidatus Rhabdochlamydia sp.]
MSRKDTIIIAVLLNAGLLIMLFASSLKVDTVQEAPSPVTVVASHHPQAVKEPVKKVESTPISIDPLDQVIEQYITPNLPSHKEPEKALEKKGIITSPLVSSQEGSYRGTREVIVKKGDVLEKIARHHLVTVSDIIELNQLSSTNLKIGQVLKIPASTKQSAPVKEEGYYTVKAGDNPWMIAVKHRMKVEDLLKLNHLNEESAKRLKAGDKIRIQ